MKSKFTKGLIGFFIGMFFMAGLIGTLASSMILKERPSKYDLEKTVEKITEAAQKEGWVVSGVLKIDKSIKKHGGKEVRPVRIINICQPHYASQILQKDKDRIVSVMMPCTISVYEQSDGNVYVATTNSRLLGKLFGGTVSKIMGRNIAAEQKKIIRTVIE
jgi:uncharacterized protein (DUF302 family)